MPTRDERLSISSLADEVAPPEANAGAKQEGPASGLELNLETFQGRAPGRAKPPAPRRPRPGLRPIDWSQERQAARDVLHTDRGVRLVTRVISALLAVRLALSALAATGANDFTRLVGEITFVLARPFSRFFEDVSLGDGRLFETGVFVALCTYFLVGTGLARLLRR